MFGKTVLSFFLAVMPALCCISVPYVQNGELSLGYESWSAREYFDVWGEQNLTLQQFDQYMEHTYTVSGHDYWADMGMSMAEKQVVFDFLSHGYSAKRMTPEEYALFLDNATKVNADMTTCAMYGAVAYKGGWAGYVFSPDSEKTENCEGQGRALCSGGFVIPFLNDLPSQDNTTGSNYSGTGMHQDYFEPGSTPWLVIGAIIVIVAAVPFFIWRVRLK